MPTVRLYLDDPHLFEFDATVVAHGEHQGRPTVVLDRSAFYPEAGGQMADHGRLDDLPVVDVQVGADGEVHHVVEGDVLPQVGAKVVGRLDRARRLQHMAQHTGQHALSALLTRMADAPTLSSRLGETACTIDVRREALPREVLDEVEEALADLIEADVPVRCTVPSPDELAAMTLRRSPKVDHDVRVVAIGDVDLVPCGGTHCTSTRQIGLLTILGAERYKGNTRVTFAAGRRARRLLAQHASVLRDLGRSLTCGALDVPRAVAALRRERDEARGALKQARARLAAHLADALLARPEPMIVARLDEDDAPLLRQVGCAVAAHPDRAVALAAPVEDGLALFVARGEAHDLDCGALVRAIVSATGGRGGGRPDHAEGRLPADIDWEQLVVSTTRDLTPTR